MNYLKLSLLSELKSAMVNNLFNLVLSNFSVLETSSKIVLKIVQTSGLLKYPLLSASQSQNSFLAIQITSSLLHIFQILQVNLNLAIVVSQNITLLIIIFFILQISQMSIHIVTQIKRDVDEVQMRQYSANKQKKQLKHFSLYLKQIVKIQRFYRSYLVLKTKRLEKQIVEQLKKKQLQYFREKDLSAQIQKAKKKRERLLNTNINKMIEHQKQNICENVRQMIKNVVNCADKYAKNSAVSKISMGQLQKCIKQQKELKAEIKELQLQKQCYEQRMDSWENKLKQIRERTMQQMSIRNQLEAELEDCQ